MPLGPKTLSNRGSVSHTRARPPPLGTLQTSACSMSVTYSDPSGANAP
jgi:hypothetical protein